jgi:hypothetical protein
MGVNWMLVLKAEIAGEKESPKRIGVQIVGASGSVIRPPENRRSAALKTLP